MVTKNNYQLRVSFVSIPNLRVISVKHILRVFYFEFKKQMTI